jgi:hypothetical protein
MDLQELFDAAEAHGDDQGSDAEVGDLQDALRVACGLMTDEQRRLFWEHEDVGGLVERESG